MGVVTGGIAVLADGRCGELPAFNSPPICCARDNAAAKKSLLIGPAVFAVAASRGVAPEGSAPYGLKNCWWRRMREPVEPGRWAAATRCCCCSFASSRSAAPKPNGAPPTGSSRLRCASRSCTAFPTAIKPRSSHTRCVANLHRIATY